MKKLSLLFSMLLALHGFAQERVLTAGFQVKPMLPVPFLNADNFTRTVDGVTLTMDNNAGYSAGMVIRKGLTKTLSFETGINYVQRNYTLGLSVDSSSFQENSTVRIIGYEIPVLGLVYIRLSDKIFMNAALGLSLDMFPTISVGNISYSGAFEHLAFRSNWMQAGLLANLGWEYRSKEKGIYYLGFSFHRPFTKIYQNQFTVTRPGADLTAVNSLRGSYFTVDLRYFFNEPPERKAKSK